MANNDFSDSSSCSATAIPLLSICIPNWNRAEQLRKTLQSIADDPAFSQGNEVEVVISDNASEDSALEVCNEFQKKFPGKVVILTEPKTINSHFNFQKALNAGHGIFLKLHNNNAVFLQGKLSALVELLRKDQMQHDIFIPQKADEIFSETLDLSLDTMIDKAGVGITWISRFCVRRSAYMELSEPFRYWHTNLPQVDILLRLGAAGHSIILFNDEFFQQQQVSYTISRQKKSERNDARIFGRNYFNLLEPYVRAGQISRKTFDAQKKKMLWEHIIPYHFDFFHQYFDVPQKGFLKYCFPRYCKNWYFYWALIYIAGYYSFSNIIPLHQLCGNIRRKLQKKT